MIGRMPSIAAPMAEPMMRVLADRRVDHAPRKFLREIFVALNAPPNSPTSCP